MERKIYFKDCGQDFLAWTIDVSGKILACEPILFCIWKDWTVMNLSALVIGGKVKLTKPGYEQIIKRNIKDKPENYIEIIYPIAKIEKLI